MDRYRRFSLRTLVVVTTVLTIWIGVVSRRANQQRRAVESLQAEGARVEYAHQFVYNAKHGPVPREPVPNAGPPGPERLRRMIGDDYFVTPIQLWHIDDLSPLAALPDVEEIFGARLDAADVPRLKRLTKLKVLMLNQMSSVEDYEFLASLPGLVHLSVNRVPFDDNDAIHLRGMPKLKWLQMSRTGVTDGALRELQHLPRLEFLNLSVTGITDDGLPWIASCRRLEHLILSQTAVTDAGLPHLASLHELRDLRLDNTAISDEGLLHLAALKNLQNLSVRNTAVSESGISRLQQALPGVMINRKPWK